MKLKVKVVTNSSKRMYEVLGENELKVKIHSTPQKGKANKELLEFLSEIFNVPKSNIKIIKGEKSNRKEIEVKGIYKSLEEVI